ncbi:MAG: hypothetical protein PHP32_00810 [Candidatus Izemoplasmatales bacterium]|nr:hypothetical protein [Candidatus Izemoplasmatales bacterium]
MEILNRIPTFRPEDNVTGCCPVFHPDQWDGKVFDFSEMHFMQAPMKTLFHIPLSMNKVMTKAQKAIVAANAAFEDKYLILSEDLGLFHATHHFLVKSPVEGYQSSSIPGHYRAKVLDGPFSQIPTWIEELQKSQEKPLERLFAFYTTCPHCAKFYGHNYVVLFSKIV